MSRHAYLILAHSRFEQLKKLVRMLDDSRNDIFIHIDASAEDFDASAFDGLCSFSHLEFIEPRIEVNWGGLSIMEAELSLLEACCRRGGYSYCHLLSGMDLPIKSQDCIHSFFEENCGREFLNFWKMKSHTHRRFRYYTLFPEGAGKFWPNLANNLFKGLQMAFGHTINDGIEFKFASQWFSITLECAEYVVSKREWLEKVFRHTNTVDEIFLATLLWNSHFRDRLYDSSEHVQNSDIDSAAALRFIDWTRGGSVRHPWTFRLDDWDLLMSVPHFWARKFDENIDGEIIDRLYNHFAGSGNPMPSACDSKDS